MEQRIYELKADVTSLRRDVDGMNLLVDRLDVAIDKMSEMSSHISQLLAVHDTKIEQQERMIGEVAISVDQRRLESEDRTNVLHKRITDLRQEVTNNSDKRTKEILEEISKLNANLNEKFQHMENRVIVLERWRFLLMGGAITIGFLLAKLPLINWVVGN